MGINKQDILDALEDLETDELKKFKWQLRLPENVEGLKPLTKRALENADTTDIVDLITQSYSFAEAQLVMVKVLRKINRNDLAERFENTPEGKW